MNSKAGNAALKKKSQTLHFSRRSSNEKWFGANSISHDDRPLLLYYIVRSALLDQPKKKATEEEEP